MFFNERLGAMMVSITFRKYYWLNARIGLIRSEASKWPGLFKNCVIAGLKLESLVAANGITGTEIKKSKNQKTNAHAIIAGALREHCMIIMVSGDELRRFVTLLN
jgi:hypothetical protein